jgi:cysteine desulfurase
VSAIEHSSVLKHAGEGVIAVTPAGIIDLLALETALKNQPPALVSVMLANNETGVIQPIAEIATLVHAHGGLLHCDAAQALGKMPVDFGALGADMLTLSAHKCGGPVGAAALVVRRNLPLHPLLVGGGQELGRRAGTENVAAIAGFAAAVGAIDLVHMRELEGWRGSMEAVLVEAGGVVFGNACPRLPNTTCVAMPGVSAEVQLMHCDLAGVSISAGSACSSGRIAPSHVLAAMGVPESLAASAIRVSSGWGSTRAHYEAFIKAWMILQQRQTHKKSNSVESELKCPVD